MRQTVARWVIDHDPDATRRCFAQLSVGSGCDCAYCRNFVAAVGEAFPAEFLAWLAVLGVDPTKPAELCHWNREPSGLYDTGGWFHLVGSIVAGEDLVEDDGTYQFEELVPGLQVGFTARLALVPEAFAGLPLVQFEFQTLVPWVLAEPEPDEEPADGP